MNALVSRYSIWFKKSACPTRLKCARCWSHELKPLTVNRVSVLYNIRFWDSVRYVESIRKRSTGFNEPLRAIFFASRTYPLKRVPRNDGKPSTSGSTRCLRKADGKRW